LKMRTDRFGFSIVPWLAIAADVAQANVTGPLAATSVYMFRGIGTSEGAAVQGRLNYAHETGFYASAWGSNIDETLESTEVDVYGGWIGDLGDITRCGRNSISIS
jgi:uncharacterized protein (TIGR02001 family)